MAGEGGARAFVYAYNELGLRQVVYPGGREIRNGFDGAGRVSGVTESKSGAVVSSYAGGIGYDAFGAIARLTLGNGKLQDMCYNSRRQMTGLRVGDAGDETCQSEIGN